MAACYANPGAVRKPAELSSYISRHVIWKFSNASADNNLSLWTYKSSYSPKHFMCV